MREHGRLGGTGPWWDWEVTVVLWWILVGMTVLTFIGIVVGLLQRL